MTVAAPAFSVIYIYTLSRCISGTPPNDNNEIASALNMLESDVVRCWEYWCNEGLINYNPDTDEVEFPGFGASENKSIYIEGTQEKTKPVQKVVIDSPMDYSPDELSIYSKKYPQVKKLFELAQHYMGRLLTHRDLSIIFSLYDYYKLTLDVLDMLFSHCSSKGHTNMKYIEAVAQDWVNNGITTASKVTEYMAANDKLTCDGRRIMKAFGQSNREPVKFETDYIKKWLDYNFEFEILEKACERTIANTGKCNFQYCDKMLTEWHKNGIKTLEQIQLADEKYYAEKTAAKSEKPLPRKTSAPPTQKKNRFVNYEQRSDWDFEELEKLEREYAKRKLEG
ncbi:MAG: DnaD domain protein [Oscillospiraceae bacterium]